ncbi:MAG: hypothetical protein ABFC56_02960 [Clostridiaceae bacterium]
MTTTPVFFGSGSLIMRRTDVTYPTPVTVGVMQEVQVDFDFQNKELIGQNQFPVDVARAAGKITGKAKFALIYGRTINDMFFGDTLTTGAGTLASLLEAHSVPSSSTYTVTVTHAADYEADQGVFYAATGLPLYRVAPASEVAGAYSVDEDTGIYTFASADASAALLFNYTYSSTSMIKIAGDNKLMGSSPVFEVLLAESYKSNVLNIKLFQAISTKLSFPFKNTDHSIQDFEFSAYANSAGHVYEITASQ